MAAPATSLTPPGEEGTSEAALWVKKTLEILGNPYVMGFFMIVLIAQVWSIKAEIHQERTKHLLSCKLQGCRNCREFRRGYLAALLRNLWNEVTSLWELVCLLWQFLRWLGRRETPEDVDHHGTYVPTQKEIRLRQDLAIQSRRVRDLEAELEETRQHLTEVENQVRLQRITLATDSRRSHADDEQSHRRSHPQKTSSPTDGCL